MKKRRTPLPDSTALNPTSRPVMISLDTGDVQIMDKNSHRYDYGICADNQTIDIYFMVSNSENTHNNKHTEDYKYLGESLADVKQRWSGNGVSEVGGRKQQGRHLQIDQLETQKQTY